MENEVQTAMKDLRICFFIGDVLYTYTISDTKQAGDTDFYDIRPGEVLKLMEYLNEHHEDIIKAATLEEPT